MSYNEYETEDLRLWILNDELYFNKVNKVLNDFNLFVNTVKDIILSLNRFYDFLNFKNYEIDFKTLFNYFNDY